MPNNTTINVGLGGDVIRDIDRGGVKTQVAQIDIGGLGAEVLVVAGQKTTAFSLPVTLASNQPTISTAFPPAINNWGQSLGLAPNSTGTIASIASSAIGYQVKGFVAHSTGDGYWMLRVTNITVLSGRTRGTSPNLVIILQNGISIPTGSLVELRVTNEAGLTADYEATLLGA